MVSNLANAMQLRDNDMQIAQYCTYPPRRRCSTHYLKIALYDSKYLIPPVMACER